MIVVLLEVKDKKALKVAIRSLRIIVVCGVPDEERDTPSILWTVGFPRHAHPLPNRIPTGLIIRQSFIKADIHTIVAANLTVLRDCILCPTATPRVSLVYLVRRSRSHGVPNLPACLDIRKTPRNVSRPNKQDD